MKTALAKNHSSNSRRHKSRSVLSLAEFDNDLRKRHNVQLVGGVDEAGRGALAGPVVAATVVLDETAKLDGVNDSKQLTPEQREGMVERILSNAKSASLGFANADEVDRINILQATHRAADRALSRLKVAPEFLVTDYLKLRYSNAPILAITKGDSTSLAVAAASVLAKVARDRLMRLVDEVYPNYGFAKHKGYGTAAHLEALRVEGPSDIHRLSFAGVCWFGNERQTATVTSGKISDTKQSIADFMALLKPDCDLETALRILGIEGAGQ